MLFSSSAPFDPRKDIPSLAGKVILVTGANIGLGKHSCLEFARHNPAQLWLAARDLDKAKAAADEITKEVPGAPVKLLKLDLASLESIKKGAKEFSAESDRLDILMLNAGIMATPPALTQDGYEAQFGTNHMGHALLTKLLLPTLVKTAKEDASDVRVVSLSSGGHRAAPADGIRFDSLKTTADEMGPFGRYGQSKLANILFARHLAKLYPQLTVSAIHPGLVRSGLLDRATGSPLLRSIGLFVHNYVPGVYYSTEDGAKNQLWASVAKGVQSGEYYVPVGVGGKARTLGKDDKLAERLWIWTEKELEGHSG